MVVSVWEDAGWLELPATKGMALGGAAPCRGAYADVWRPCPCCRIQLDFSLPRLLWAPSVLPSVAHLLITPSLPPSFAPPQDVRHPHSCTVLIKGPNDYTIAQVGWHLKMGLGLGAVELGWHAAYHPCSCIGRIASGAVTVARQPEPAAHAVPAMLTRSLLRLLRADQGRCARRAAGCEEHDRGCGRWVLSCVVLFCEC